MQLKAFFDVRRSNSGAPLVEGVSYEKVEQELAQAREPEVAPVEGPRLTVPPIGQAPRYGSLPDEAFVVISGADEERLEVRAEPIAPVVESVVPAVEADAVVHGRVLPGITVRRRGGVSLR